MTQLAAPVDADDELWTLDTLPPSPYVQVQDELVEVRARFPEHIYQATQELLPPKIRVRRAQSGTTAASHSGGATLVPVYGVGGAGGGGAIAVTGTDGEGDPITVSDVTILRAAGVSESAPGEAEITTFPATWSFDEGDFLVGAETGLLIGDEGAQFTKIEVPRITHEGQGMTLASAADGMPIMWAEATDGIAFFENVGAEFRFRVLRSGAILMPGLPTANPNVADQLWNDAGTLKVSAG